jgi:diguanylate cyclase (GGDEF)-like protein
MDTEPSRTGAGSGHPPSESQPWRSRAATAIRVAGLPGAALIVVLDAGSERWTAPTLAVLLGLAVAGELRGVEMGTRTSRVAVSASFLALMLAAVLLGPGAAALVGVASMLAGWLRSRYPLHRLVNNLVTYAWFPVLAGLAFHWARHALGVGVDDTGYYLLVFGTFVLALLLNVMMVAGLKCLEHGTSWAGQTGRILRPILAAELFSDLLTLVAVYLATHLGLAGLGRFAIILIVFQYLVAELITSEHRAEKLRRVATTDELTGLPNRKSFGDRLSEEITACQTSHQSFAVMLIDLDRFAEINDTLGHQYGDRLLGELGPRIAERFGEEGVVARLGGDEFAVLPGWRTDSLEELERTASDLIACVHQPTVIDEITLEVSSSVGIARYPADGTDAETLLRRADIALYEAKEHRDAFRFYDPAHDHHSTRRLSLLGDFRRALANDEIVVHYQPIVDLCTQRATGAEALVRWEHKSLGLIQPGEFLPSVEQTGLIAPLTEHVLDRAISQCAQWHREGDAMTISVNLSVRNLLDPSLPAQVGRMLRRHALSPEALQLEITESMILSDPARALAVVRELRHLGVRLAVDDFGTGHSSLANLRMLPIAKLKIDRSFVTPMLRDENDLIIVRSTINLGHDLGLSIIAEGVEDIETLNRLEFLGCDQAQGYYLSRPIPAESFTSWMEDFSSDSGRRLH